MELLSFKQIQPFNNKHLMNQLFKLVFLATIIMISFASASFPSKDDFVNSYWKYYNDNGYLGLIKFQPNGTISNYVNDNEKTWSINSNNILQIFDINGKVSSRYVLSFKDDYSKWRLQGKFLGTGQTPGWTHYLEQLI